MGEDEDIGECVHKDGLRSVEEDGAGTSNCLLVDFALGGE